MRELPVPKQPQRVPARRDARMVRFFNQRLKNQGASEMTIRRFTRTALRYGAADAALGRATRRLFTAYNGHLVTVAIALVGMRLIRRMAQPSQHVVWRARLDPGDAIQLRGLRQD